ncbi:hypothetical protein K9N68_34030 (plasmid) [Kovacikia minuta CCNUW1]|uniref:hypothetical protein n=1 Tax=Kovacikia minuta TaxID=2931930 RepID=UPI001CCA4057|nr:hypothetical protein [Kovacikia minuta]UBF30242.1 hypothetical protein K9N68_34030 [Kovacikia minuta CCNUW1]
MNAVNTAKDFARNVICTQVDCPPSSGEFYTAYPSEDDDWGLRLPVNLVASSSPSFGYFADGGATFYTDGQTFCGFLAPAHYQIHRFGQDSIPRLGNRSRWELGSDGGACSVASGYFAYNNATHYSLGNGQYCSFFAGDAYERHRSRRPQEPRFGLLESDPEGFMTWTGGCSE